MDWLRRLDVIVLVFMLAYVLAVVGQFFYHYQIVRDSREVNRATLNVQARTLKSIADSAPYLGFLGTCFGIMSALYGFPGGSMERNSFLAMFALGIARALITTAAGILVATPATCAYNYLCRRIDLLAGEEPVEVQIRLFQGRKKFPLKKKFTQLPVFALTAAPGLAMLVAVFTPFFAPREPTGFGISLASARCEEDDNGDRLVVLHVTNAGKLFLNNTEEENWRNLAGRLSEIYSLREHRTLYLLAEEGVSFQTVADAIDIVESAESAAKTEPLDITVRLVTPAAMKVRCVLHPVPARSSLQLSE